MGPPKTYGCLEGICGILVGFEAILTLRFLTCWILFPDRSNGPQIVAFLEAIISPDRKLLTKFHLKPGDDRRKLGFFT